MEAIEKPMAGAEESQVEAGEMEDVRDEEEGGNTPSPALPHEARGREEEMEESEIHEQDDSPGGEPEPAD